MTELWRDIIGYEGLYQVSNYGRVRSISFRNQYCEKTRIKILNQHDNGRGYLRVALTKNAKVRHKRVHRLVAEVFLFNPAGLIEINHINFNTYDNNVDNLEWISHEDNVKYSKDNGRYKNNRRW